jgi:hypothetical protein
MAKRSTHDDIISDAWYPSLEDYWVPAADAEQPGTWPHRFGDIFHTPATDANGTPLAAAAGTPWDAVMAYSPSCELISKAKETDTIEVVRVLRLDTQPDANAVKAIVAGWQEKDSRITVAFAHTVFLAPVEDTSSHNFPMFAHLKTTARVTLADLRAVGRIAALTHDARVAVIRRDLYYRYRWLVPMADVKAAETDRIAFDPHFTPPRPGWAPASLQDQDLE